MAVLTNVALFILAILSVALYLAIIVLLIKRRNKKNFNSAFYKIFISLGLIDISQLINSYITLRCPIFGMFPTLYSSDFTIWLAKYACFAVWYFIFGQFIGNLLMAINRYTAFKFANYNDTLWTPLVTKAACLAPWLLPIPLAFHCLFQDAKYVPLFDNRNETIGYSLQLTVQAYEVNSIVGKSFVSIVTVMTGVLYGGALASLRRLRRMQAFNWKSKLHAETRLLCCALVIFLAMLTYTAYQLLSLILLFSARMDLIMFLYELWYIVADMFTLINPWSVFLLSGTVRRGLLGMFGRRNDEPPSGSAFSRLL